KIERNADAGYAIAILSAADSRRQNVIFELGFFLGRLGSRRVRALVTPGVEIPSDVHGMLYIEKDDRGRWKDVLTRELVDAGVTVTRTETDAQKDSRANAEEDGGFSSETVRKGRAPRHRSA